MKLRFWQRDPADTLPDYSDLTKLAAIVQPDRVRLSRAARQFAKVSTSARDVERAFSRLAKAFTVFEIPSGIRIERPRTPRPAFDPPGQKPKPPPGETVRE